MFYSIGVLRHLSDGLDQFALATRLRWRLLRQLGG